MKLIKRDTDYAIRALCYIAQSKDDVISVSRLVEHLNIPRPFLRKILQRLNKKGLLISYKGKGGGFSLGRKAGKIFLADLICIFQGTLKINECFLRKKTCPDTKSCPLKKKIDSIEKYVILELKKTTIGTLVG